MKIAIIGVTGAVGREILHLLEKRFFPVNSLRCFASPKNVGNRIPFKDTLLTIEALEEKSFEGIDLAFFAAGSRVSREFVPIARRSHTLVIDSSSLYRMEQDVPLVIPEINAHTLKNKGLVASPNCAATVLLMPLAPLHRLYRVKRIVASTYQAASGGGAKLHQQLLDETRGYLLENKRDLPYAFNLFLHNSSLHESGYVEEERKMAEETRKILEDDEIRMSCTCVRVPVLRAHSISVNVEFYRPFSLAEVREIVLSTPGVRLFEDVENNRFPTPSDATGMDEVLCGRFRIDPSQSNTLEFWAVGDQLLKGAALNAVQIAETILINDRTVSFLSSRDVERSE
jgi:aspartate-semialdehyde dehydrogenase